MEAQGQTFRFCTRLHLMRLQILPIRQFLIAPSIDPLSNKNKELPQETIDAALEKYAVLRDKPIITQISRFDRLKDPVGVIEAYKLVKKYIDCRLILAGGTATDDPEGMAVLNPLAGILQLLLEEEC